MEESQKAMGQNVEEEKELTKEDKDGKKGERVRNFIQLGFRYTYSSWNEDRQGGGSQCYEYAMCKM